MCSDAERFTEIARRLHRGPGAPTREEFSRAIRLAKRMGLWDRAEPPRAQAFFPNPRVSQPPRVGRERHLHSLPPAGSICRTDR